MPDVVVIGLGAAGSALVDQLARRGVDVLGIDRFSPPHDLGSTHGETRITRLAVGEGSTYTPLVQRSHHIWRELEAETGAELLTLNGCLVLQDAGAGEAHGAADFLATTVDSGRSFGVAVEELDAAAVRARFPQFAAPEGTRACFEPGGGFVRPEAVVAAQLDSARRHGAEIHTGERVLSLQHLPGGVRIRTERASYDADRCVLCAGPWLRALTPPEVASLFTVVPQTLCWFDDASGGHTADAMPAFIWVLRGPTLIYGVPQVSGLTPGVKVGTEQFTEAIDPDAGFTAPSGAAARLWEELVGPRLPGVGPRTVRTATCLYTVTSDMGFAVDTLPGDDRTLLVSACSGHGFKHSAGIGEAVAQLLTDGHSDVDLAPFALGRLQAPAGRG
ncbi:MAG: N-methyl-L-tryptophan oxidase [Candidatus Dormibacteraeota bacterium]|nr:N-methyl-L-tryptophan oxidase [Candidatus Dormibacteraeota bacterium]